MAPILIEPLSEQAYELLRQLEALHILRVVPAAEAPAPAKRQWAGSLSSASAEAWDKHLLEIRGEWERNI
ncbi:hypothetical protein ACFQ48_20020 [Hymenobacter caeli]|uniref:DUF2281 domain-containing protein n=1 Tax=Hymenobacter caeli TaxID=2735894 RepID=A0ABX2FW65_9BACT|nr:hypothetical protein [Hymenobacter caeli]NRT21251.1 hypothetical protein [Hymenobacter caeli]